VPRFPRTRATATLDGLAYVGQRSSSWRFDIVDAVTGYRRAIHPVISGSAGIRHDTRSTVKRTITGLTLNAEDTAIFNSLSSRLEPFMIIGDEEFQVGRYVPSDWARFLLSSGSMSSASFYDEGFIVDQQITNAFGAISTGGEVVSAMIQRFMSRFPTLNYYLEQNLPEYTSLGSWSAGTRGGFIIDQLALDGNYLPPWFDNSSLLRFKPPFDASVVIPTFDFDVGTTVISASIVESDNLIDAPNRFVVIGNGIGSMSEVAVGVADVPSSAPHSIVNRGFVVADVQNRQVMSAGQAGAFARNLALNQTLDEQTELSPLSEPRHDGFDLVRRRGENWVEIAWNLPFDPSSPMSHTLRKVYS
jgi:hypothetical protein